MKKILAYYLFSAGGIYKCLRKKEMRKKTLAIAAIITTIIGLGAFIFSASASPGWWVGKMNGNNEQWREKIRNAFENKDYNAWKNLMEERHRERMSLMTEEKFNKMAEMRKLMQEGKYDEAKKLREELGLPIGGKWNSKDGKFMGKWKSSECGCGR